MPRETALPRKVLLVDDRVEVRKSLTMCLELLGFETASAPSGAEALAMVSQARFDLILLDVDMPLMDGFEVCKRLKADRATFLIPVIFVSGRVGFDDREEAMRCGAIDFLAKPFDLETLKQCVVEALLASEGAPKAIT